MICPKCNVSQPESDECVSCGLIFKKFRPSDSRKRQRTQPRYIQKKKLKSKSDRNIWIIVLIISAISIGSFFLVFTKRHRSSESPVQASVNQTVMDKNEQESSPADALQAAIDAMVIVRSPWAEGYGFFISDQGHVLTPKRIVSYEKNDTDPVWVKIQKLNYEINRKQKRLDALELKIPFKRINDHSFWETMHAIDALRGEIEYCQRQIEQFETPSKIYTADGTEGNIVFQNISESMNVALLSVDIYSSSYIKPLKTWPTDEYLSKLLADAHKPNGNKAYVVSPPKGLNELKIVKAIFSHNTTYGANHYSITITENININAIGSPLLNNEGLLLGICDFEFYQGKGTPILPILEEFGSVIGY